MNKILITLFALTLTALLPVLDAEAARGMQDEARVRGGAGRPVAGVGGADRSTTNRPGIGAAGRPADGGGGVGRAGKPIGAARAIQRTPSLGRSYMAPTSTSINTQPVYTYPQSGYNYPGSP